MKMSDEEDVMGVCWRAAVARPTVREHSGTSRMQRTHKQTPTQEPLEAQVVPREARTFHWCWVMLTTSPALQDWDESIGWGCHKRSHISGSYSVLYQLLQFGLGNNITIINISDTFLPSVCFSFLYCTHKNRILSAGSLNVCLGVCVCGTKAKCEQSFSHFPD